MTAQSVRPLFYYIREVGGRKERGQDPAFHYVEQVAANKETKTFVRARQSYTTNRERENGLLGVFSLADAAPRTTHLGRTTIAIYHLPGTNTNTAPLVSISVPGSELAHHATAPPRDYVAAVRAPCVNDPVLLCTTGNHKGRQRRSL